MSDDSNAEQATRAVNDALNDWFRHIGTQLSDDDYEAGIQVIAAHDEQVRASERERAALVAEKWWPANPFHAHDIAKAIRATPAEQKESNHV